MVNESPVSTSSTNDLSEVVVVVVAAAVVAYLVDLFSDGGVIRAIGRRLYPPELDEELITETLDASGIVAEATRITRGEVE